MAKAETAKATKRSGKEGELPNERMVYAVMGPYRGQTIYAGDDYDQCIAEGWAVDAFGEHPSDEIPEIDEKVELARAMSAKWAESGGPDVTGVEPPEPAPPATLTSIDPNTAVLGDPDVTLHCYGTGFTPSSALSFAGQPEPIVFVSAEEITTIVKPSLPWGAVTVPVQVDDSAPLNFTFTEAAPARSTEAAAPTRGSEAAPARKPETAPTRSSSSGSGSGSSRKR